MSTLGYLFLAVFTPALQSAGRDQDVAASSLMPDAGSKVSDRDSGAESRSSVPDYVVSPEDQLDVFVFDVPEVSRTYRVSPSGYVSLPLLPKPISAAGLTPAELSRVIAERFQDAGLLVSPQVTVSVRETRRHSLVIAGAVKNPQIYPVYGPIRLLDVISQAGGLTDDAGNICVISRGAIALRALAGENQGRAEGFEKVSGGTTSVDVRKLVETGDEHLNLLLYPGDRINVQRAPIVYVIGAVARPGGYPLKDPQEEITVLKALALAGDVTGSAQRSKLVILRKGSPSSSQRVEVRLDLRKIIAGHAPDQKLQGDDILFVPENGKARAIRSAIGTGIGMGSAITTGLIIYRR